MVKSSQHSAGPGCPEKRKMLRIFLWFFFSGFVTDTFCTTTVNGSQPEVRTTLDYSSKGISKATSPVKKSPTDSYLYRNQKFDESTLDRVSRAVPRTKTTPESSLESISKSEDDSDILPKISQSELHQYELNSLFRPLEKVESQSNYNNKKRNTIIPMARFGRSVREGVSDVELDGDSFLSKRYDTVIPMIRFGRANNLKRGTSNSVIPYSRLGRSSMTQSESKMNNNIEEKIDEFLGDEMENDATVEEENNYDLNNNIYDEDDSVSDEIEKRGLEDYENTKIPYPRPGRDALEDSFLEGKSKKADFDFMVPQMRYGRSMLLLTPPKTEETSKQKPTHTFVLPYPRPGRSNKHIKIGKVKYEHLILPYPRPGRSGVEENFVDIPQYINNEKRHMLPSARFDRPAIDIHYESGKDRINLDEEGFLGLKFNPLFLKSGQKNQAEKPNEKNENTSVFVIPYPRPGKKSMFKIKNGKQSSNNGDKGITEYVLPYPRPGRETDNLFNDIDGDLSNALYMEQNTDTHNTLESRYNKDAPTKNSETVIISYGRLGRSYGDIVPYPRPGRSANEYTDLNSFSDDEYFNGEETELKNILETDYTGPKKDDYENLRIKRSSTVVSYPSFGKSNYVVPYPRLGRSNSVVPYPRLGRSNSVVPYPRLGRSNAVVPYPRPGRSNSVVPYPRLGRSDSVVPYPRPGRSDSVVPYPRLGRSNSVVPYPRTGRSNSVVPYPRLGRSGSVVPYPRPGRSNSVVPYPRLGRSGSVVPYPRPGRSNSVVPYRRLGRSGSIVPYPRPGRSYSVVPYPRLGRSQREMSVSSNKDNIMENLLLMNLNPVHSTSKKGDHYIVPYPRPGRSEDEIDSFHKTQMGYPMMKKNPSKSIIPYPRFGRSKQGQGYILPHPRIGRSEEQGRKDRDTNDTDTVIPYPRLGRSERLMTPSQNSVNSIHKLNKHMITNVDDSIYLLPYPRPGRYTE